jgi:hypothetical protein
MLMLKVIAVNGAGKVKTYSSPSQVNMLEVNSNTPLQYNTTQIIPAGTPSFTLRTNISVTFTVNCTARFEHFRQDQVTTLYDARGGFTFWNATFTSDDKPSSVTYPYTWSNKTLRVSQIPQFWSRASPPTNVTNDGGFSSSFVGASTYYNITQTSGVGGASWDANWTIATVSTYKISASLPSQVVAGLPLTLNVLTNPYSPSSCNVTFYNSTGNSIYSNNVTAPSTSFQLTLKLNDTGVNSLLLFDRWTGRNEASFNNTLTVDVLSPDCNVTVNDRNSPVIGSTAMLRFKFYNNSLGMDDEWIEPTAVSINGTLTTNFDYNDVTGNTTVYMNTGSGGWRTGNNTVTVSAKSGVFNASKQTWIVVQEPLCNVTAIGINQPFPGNEGILSFRFFNKTVGASPLLINPTEVRINGTVTYFTYSSGIVTTNWSTAIGGWQVGLNYVNVSATSGTFSNFTVASFTIIPALCNVSVSSVNQPILGNNASLSFRFYNKTAGATPLLINPASVAINGTNRAFTYSAGVVTVAWNTTFGGWRAGLNHVSVSATRGIFSNSTVYTIDITQPQAVLLLNATSYSAVYGDVVNIGLKFLNTTFLPESLLPPSLLYLNGSQISCTVDGEWYVYSLDTVSQFSTAGSFHLNFTARYGSFYAGVNVTSIILDRISMTLTLTVAQSSVAVGSSLSVSAALAYTANGTHAPKGLTIQFEFVVTYADRHNATIPMSRETDDNGTAIATLLATSNMTSIRVQATYGGSAILYGDTDLKGGIPVTPPTPFPILIVVGATGVGAFVVIAALFARSRRRVGKAKEARKVSRLTEAASLAQLVVVHLASGRNVFSRNLGSEESVDPQLISGFLTANQAVLGEAFKRKAGATLKSADYGDYKVISHVGRYVMSTLFSTDVPGKELRDTLEGFTKKFEDKFADKLVNWDGTMDAFRDAEEIAAEAFALALCCPYMIDEAVASNAKLSGVETRVLREATKLSVDRGVFFMPRIIDFLLTKEKVKRSKAVDILDALGKKGVLKMLTVDEAAQIVREKERAADSSS